MTGSQRELQKAAKTGLRSSPTGVSIKLTESEYRYLVNEPGDDVDVFYEDGLQCYENGWVDDFGFVTPKGEAAVKDYERDQ